MHNDFMKVKLYSNTFNKRQVLINREHLSEFKATHATQQKRNTFKCRHIHASEFATGKQPICILKNTIEHIPEYNEYVLEEVMANIFVCLPYTQTNIQGILHF